MPSSKNFIQSCPLGVVSAAPRENPPHKYKIKVSFISTLLPPHLQYEVRFDRHPKDLYQCQSIFVSLGEHDDIAYKHHTPWYCGHFYNLQEQHILSFKVLSLQSKILNEDSLQ